MDVVVALLVVLLLAAVVLVVTAPLRRDPTTRRGRVSARRAELEAARDAKYREIRDNELDYRTGKLSEQDFATIDRALRADAVAILHELDSLDD